MKILNKKLSIIIPMAEAGSRFQKEGYNLQKPFIDIKGKMIIEMVLDGIQYENANYILIIQKSFLNEYKDKLNLISAKYNNIHFLTVEKLTQGASCTVLSIHNIINNNNPILICDCDNIIDNNVFKKFVTFKLDGTLITFYSNNDTCFSFAKVAKNSYVSEIKEKKQSLITQ